MAQPGRIRSARSVADARNGGPARKILARDVFGDLGDLLTVQPLPVDAAAFIAPQSQLDAGQRGQCPGRAKQMVALGVEDIGPEFRFDRCEQAAQLGAHFAIAAGGQFPAAMTLGEFDHADRNRRPGDDLVPDAVSQPASAHEDQFRRSAADIEDQRAIEFTANQLQAAGRRKPRLFFRRDDGQRDAGFGFGASDEILRIGGAAAGLRGDRFHMGHAATAQPRRANLQRGNGAVERRVGDGSPVRSRLSPSRTLAV